MNRSVAPAVALLALTAIGACGGDGGRASDAFCDTARDVGDELPFMVVDPENPEDLAAMKEFLASWASDAPDDIARDMLTLGDDFQAVNEDLGNAEVSSDELEARHSDYFRANERFVAFVRDRVRR